MNYFKFDNVDLIRAVMYKTGQVYMLDDNNNFFDFYNGSDSLTYSVNLRHVFSTKTFFVITDITNSSFITALSLSTTPEIYVINQNAAIAADDNNKPNTYNSVKYFSLNQGGLIDTLLSSGRVIRELDGTIAVDTNCASTIHKVKGEIFQCVPDCTETNYRLNYTPDGFNICYYFCLPNYNNIYFENKCTYQDCPDYNGYYWANNTAFKTCVADCGVIFSYKDGEFCTVKCPIYVKPIQNIFDQANEIGHCLPSCPISDFLLETPYLEYDDFTPKKYCLDLCVAPWDKFMIGGTNYCTDDCLTENTLNNIPFGFRYTEGLQCHAFCPLVKPYIFVSGNQNTVNEYGSCEASCNPATSYVLQQPDYVYPNDSSIKTYCLTDCPYAPYTIVYEEEDTSNIVILRHCVNSCDPAFMTRTFAVKKYFLKSATPYDLCVSACPVYNKLLTGVTLNDDLVGICDTTCGAQFYLEHPYGSGVNYCIDQCPSSQHRHYDNGVAGKHCTATCSDPYPYTHSTTKQCIDSCPVEDLFVDDDKNCLNFCYAPTYFLTGSHCGYSCLEGYLYYQNVNFTNICNLVCQATLFIEIEPMQINENLYELESLSKAKECKTNCNNYKLYSHLKFAYSNHTKNFCIHSCPIAYYQVEYSPFDKECLLECDVNSAYKFKTPDYRCVYDCHQAGYLYQNEDSTCSDECSAYIDEDKYCVKECPSVRQFVELSRCTNKCSNIFPMIQNYFECSKTCPGRFYDNVCVSTCTESNLVKFYAKNSLPYQDRPYTLETLACATYCPINYMPFINEITLDCMDKCPPT